MNMITESIASASTPYRRAETTYYRARAEALANPADNAAQADYGEAVDALLATRARGYQEVARKIQAALDEQRGGPDVLRALQRDMRDVPLEEKLLPTLRDARSTIAEEVDSMRLSFCDTLPDGTYGEAPCPEEAELLEARTQQLRTIDQALMMAVAA